MAFSLFSLLFDVKMHRNLKEKSFFENETNKVKNAIEEIDNPEYKKVGLSLNFLFPSALKTLTE